MTYSTSKHRSDARPGGRVARRISLALAFALGLMTFLPAAHARRDISINLAKMPAVTGKSLFQAKQALKARGIPYKVKTTHAPSAQPERVLNQSPKPGKVVLPFKRATLRIKDAGSSPTPNPGPNQVLVAVPNLKNMSRSQAEAALAPLKLAARAVGPGSESLHSRVGSQDPVAGSVVPQGTQVTFHLPSTAKTLTVSLPKQVVIKPVKAGSGDRDFHGNGPHMVLKGRIRHSAKLGLDRPEPDCQGSGRRRHSRLSHDEAHDLQGAARSHDHSGPGR